MRKVHSPVHEQEMVVRVAGPIESPPTQFERVVDRFGVVRSALSLLRTGTANLPVPPKALEQASPSLLETLVD